jgi:hypothetical protein
MEAEGSLPHSQVSANFPYLESAQSSPYPHIPLPEDPSFQLPNLMSFLRCLGCTKVSVQIRGFVCEYFVTKIRFHGNELLAHRPTPILEHHPLSAVRDCLFNTFAATLHIGGRFSIRNLRTRENKQRYMLRTALNRSVFITEMKSVYSAVRTGSLIKAVCACATYSLSWLVFITEK